MKEHINSISLWIGFCLSIAYLLTAMFSDYANLILPAGLFNNNVPTFLVSNIILAIILGGLLGISIKSVLTKAIK